MHTGALARASALAHLFQDFLPALLWMPGSRTGFKKKRLRRAGTLALRFPGVERCFRGHSPRVRPVLLIASDRLHRLCSCLLGVSLLASACAGVPTPMFAQMASAPQTATSPSTGLLPATELERLLPPSVFFSGQSAPLQLRNSAAFRTKAGRMVWAGLVDTSGYSTGVREKYQFYFVTEIPVSAGSLKMEPGAYGGGFLTDNTFVLLDIAGNEMGRTRLGMDSELRRPRPLQMVMEPNGGSLRLYLGRQYLSLSLR